MSNKIDLSKIIFEEIKKHREQDEKFHVRDTCNSFDANVSSQAVDLDRDPMTQLSYFKLVARREIPSLLQN